MEWFCSKTVAVDFLTMAVLSHKHPPRPPNYNCNTAVHYDWLECSMADRSPPELSDSMMPDEMLTVLQTEMDSIKEGQQALKDEIERIKAEFYNLVHSCALDDSNVPLTASLVVPEPVCSPHTTRVRTATPGKDASPKEAPAKGGCSYGDKLIQMMLEMPSSYLDDSELSESPPVPHESRGDSSHPTEPQNTQTEGRQPMVPERLIFENDVNANQNCLQNISNNNNYKRQDSTSNLSYYPEQDNRPFVDSVRFNPDSVLNSTSICEANASLAVLNCTRAEAYPSVNCAPGLVNPASVLNCTPAGVNPSFVSITSALVNTRSIIVNPASVLDCSPAQVTQSSLDYTHSEGSSSNFQYLPADSRYAVSMNATSFDRAPSSHARHIVGEAHPSTVNSTPRDEAHPSSYVNASQDEANSSTCFTRDVIGEAQPSTCVNCTQTEGDNSLCVNCSTERQLPSHTRSVEGEAHPLPCANSTKADDEMPSSSQYNSSSRRADDSSTQNCVPPDGSCNPSLQYKSAPLGLNPSSCQPPSMISYRSDLEDPSCHSSSGSELAQPLNETTTSSNVMLSSVPDGVPATENKPATNPAVILNTTPAVGKVIGSCYNPKVLHSTPAVYTERHSHLMPANFLNPTCSAIVDYSVSSNESDQSDISSKGRGSSNGDTSDVLPNMDRQAEMMSRMKYYSDFTIDRQRKINKMRHKHDVMPRRDTGSSSQDDVPNDTLCRFVEGAEERSHQVCLIGPPYSSRSGSMGSSSSGGSSTLQKTAMSQTRYSSSPSPTQNMQTGRVLKSTENTTHFPSVAVPERRHSKASSTTSGNSTSPSSSVYAWSLQSSSQDHNTESSSHRHHRSSRHGDRKRGDKRPRTSRKRSSHHHHVYSEDKYIHCRDHDVHTMLGQPCNQVVKYFPIQQFYPKDLILSNDSLYDDGYKSQTLPRSSTKKSLNPCSSNSSLEVKRNSVPDIRALKSPPTSAHISSGSDSLSSKYPPGRMGCIGMSTTSGSQDSPGTDSSAPLSKGAPSSSLENENTALTDSILTDSPKSVSSSGIFAPCNSPDATIGSRISCSTIADSQHIDLRGISVIQPNATAIHGLSAIQSGSDISEFKVPKVPAPKRSSRRKGNRCSTPDVRTSTPKPNSYPNSVQSEQISRRKLFSSSSSTHSSYGSSSSRLLDKKSVIKKFRRFSENFYKTKSGKIQIETLANL